MQFFGNRLRCVDSVGGQNSPSPIGATAQPMINVYYSISQFNTLQYQYSIDINQNVRHFHEFTSRNRRYSRHESTGVNPAGIPGTSRRIAKALLGARTQEWGPPGKV